MGDYQFYHDRIMENLEQILDWADSHPQCQDVDRLCLLVGAVDYYVLTLINTCILTSDKYVANF